MHTSAVHILYTNTHTYNTPKRTCALTQYVCTGPSRLRTHTYTYGIGMHVQIQYIQTTCILHKHIHTTCIQMQLTAVQLTVNQTQMLAAEAATCLADVVMLPIVYLGCTSKPVLNFNTRMALG